MKARDPRSQGEGGYSRRFMQIEDEANPKCRVCPVGREVESKAQRERQSMFRRKRACL